MKGKTKALMAISVLSVGALAAAGASTFAWFQVNRTVALAYSSVTMQNRAAELSGKLISLDGTAATGSDKAQTISGATSTASDVSSKDGKAFYSPDWGMEIGNDKAPVRVNDVSEGGANTYYAEYAFSLTHKGIKAGEAGYNVKTDRPFEVYLTAGTRVFAHNDSDEAQKKANEAATSWTRVAILQGENPETPIASHDDIVSSELTPILTFESKPAAEVTADKTQYVQSKNLTGDDKLDLASYQTSDRHYVLGDEGVFANTSKDSNINSKNYLSTIASGTTSYYVVRVWLEGTENNNQRSAQGGKVDINLEINALSQAIA